MTFYQVPPISPPKPKASREKARVVLSHFRGCCKILLQEITIYNQLCAKVQAEYHRIQALIHQETNHLDQVERDGKGATSHLLDQ
jgi:hypothetical protein